MKYCTKCGNPMQDDMIFCSKCGTKVEINIEDELRAKVAELKNYDWIFKNLDWEYVVKNKKQVNQLIESQMKMFKNFQILLKEILKIGKNENVEWVESEIYPFILQLGTRCCRESEKMLSNYSGYKKFFNGGKEEVQNGKLDTNEFLKLVQDIDTTYKLLCGEQTVLCSMLKDELDVYVIYNNVEYQRLTKDFAQAFNDAWYARVKRCTDFFNYPLEPFIDTNWKIYNDILKGLPMSMIDELDEGGWVYILNYIGNEGKKEYRDEFFKKREETRKIQREKEQKEVDEKYWKLHPENYKLFEEKKNTFEQLKQQSSKLRKEIDELENTVQVLRNKLSGVESKKSKNESEIATLQKKIFGRKKAQEDITMLENENNIVIKQIDEINKQLNPINKMIGMKYKEKSEITSKMNGVKNEMDGLRHS